MGRIVKLSIVLLIVVIMTGCGTKRVTCTNETKQEVSGYNTKSKYTIYYSGDIASKVEIEEVIESKNKTVLAYFEKSLTEQYKTNNEKYKGYKYEVTNKENKVVSKVTIDYNTMDIKKFVKENPAMESFVSKDNKMLLNGVKAMYESTGAKCN